MVTASPQVVVGLVGAEVVDAVLPDRAKALLEFDHIRLIGPH